jgi:hypothetical protein
MLRRFGTEDHVFCDQKVDRDIRDVNGFVDTIRFKCFIKDLALFERPKTKTVLKKEAMLLAVKLNFLRFRNLFVYYHEYYDKKDAHTTGSTIYQQFL